MLNGKYKQYVKGLQCFKMYACSLDRQLPFTLKAIICKKSIVVPHKKHKNILRCCLNPKNTK